MNDRRYYACFSRVSTGENTLVPVVSWKDTEPLFLGRTNLENLPALTARLEKEGLVFVSLEAGPDYAEEAGAALSEMLPAMLERIEEIVVSKKKPSPEAQ